MVADGMARGGPKEACKRLADFWRAVSLDGQLPEVQRAVMDRLFSILPMEGWPVQSWFDAVSRFWSPYDLNPLNPIRSRTWSSALSTSMRCARFQVHRCSYRQPTSTPAACVYFRATNSPPT